jgi:hypothetical protein
MKDVTGFKRQDSREHEVAALILPPGVQELWFLGSYQTERKTGSDVAEFIAANNVKTMPAIIRTGSCEEQLRIQTLDTYTKSTAVF